MFVINARCFQENYEPTPAATGPQIMQDMNVANVNLPVTNPTPCLKLLVSILRKTCFTGFTGFRRLVSTYHICFIQFILGYSSTWWTGSRAFSRNTPAPGLWRHLEGATAIPGVFCAQKGLSRGHAVARKRDEEPLAVSFGGSRCSTAPARQPASNTFQTCAKLCPGTGRLQYDGAIPKPHPGDDSLYGAISWPVSQDERYLLVVSSF